MTTTGRRNLHGAIFGAVLALLVIGAGPLVWTAIFPPTPWLAFHRVADVKSVDTEDGVYMSIVYELTLARQCAATASWYYVDAAGADFREPRGRVPASVNRLTPSRKKQLMTVRFPKPVALAENFAQIGYVAEIAPIDPGCGGTVEAPVAFF